jgi:hypothetical protein
MSKIILLDGGSIQFRAIFNYIGQYNREFQNIISSQKVSEEVAIKILNKKLANREIFIGAPTWTFMKMLIGYFKILEVTLDDKIILALDFGSWRKAIDKNYKSTRREFKEKYATKEWWDEKYAQFNDLYEKIKISMPIDIVKIYLRESDDIISTAVRYYKDKEIIIISGDGDMEQLCYFPYVKIFSPVTRKFKEIKNPLQLLRNKIQKDISDNLLEAPSSEAEFEKREKIVSLIKLPLEIEQPIKEELSKLAPKNLDVNKIPYKSVRESIKKLYKL